MIKYKYLIMVESRGQNILLKVENSVLSKTFVISVLTMIFNDHFLKGYGLLPGWLTGILSDISFLFFGPILMAYLFRARNYFTLLGAYAFIGIFYTALNISPAFSDFMARSVHLVLGLKKVLWPDLADLLALPVLGLSWFFVSISGESHKRIEKSISKTRKKTIEYLIIVAASTTCIATSPPPCPGCGGESYGPIYLDWASFRTSFSALPPITQMNTGPIMVYGNYLFSNEPNEGIHIINITNKSAPVHQSFLRIWGNLSMQVKGNFLYVDSFVDLLIIDITDPQNPVLVNRLQGVFAYNPCQKPIPSTTIICNPQDYDKSNGVVIDWAPHI